MFRNAIDAFLSLFGVKSEQELAVNRNRMLAERQLVFFRDPWAPAGSKELEVFGEPKWITLQRELHK